MNVKELVIATNYLTFGLLHSDFCKYKLKVEIDSKTISKNKLLIHSVGLLTSYHLLLDWSFTEITIDYQKNGKKISKSFNLDNYSEFVDLYNDANHKFDHIYYRRYDDYSVFVYELHKNRENVAILCNNPKKYITHNIAKQIFDSLLKIEKIHQIFELPDEYTVGLYYDIDDGDHSHIILSDA